MRSIGLGTKVVQLIDGNDYDFKNGGVTYISNDVYNFIDGRPYSWLLAGDGRTFGDMLTPAGLAEIKTYADGIGPWKPQVLNLRVTPWKDGAGLADVNTVSPSDVIAHAHAAGLFVHVYTFRNEAKYLAGAFNGDPLAEYAPFFAAGVDGVFTDFTGTGVTARAAFLKTLGR